MSSPFGWDPGIWLTILVLGSWATFLAIAWPISARRRTRMDRAERERIAGVLRDLAAEMGGEFIGPRPVLVVDDDGNEYGRWPDYGTAQVTSSGLAVDVGIQVGSPAAKCLRLHVKLPDGRGWSVERLRARRLGPWLAWWPAPRTFRLGYVAAGTAGLSEQARAALEAMRVDAIDLLLKPDALVVWVLRARSRTSVLADGVTDAAQLVPYVHRAADLTWLLTVPASSPR